MAMLFDKTLKQSRITNVGDLLALVDSLCPRKYRFDSIYLRGHANAGWGLKPSIARDFEHAGKKMQGFRTDRELYLLHRFRRYTWEFFRREIDDVELMLLARHHKVPVRLLDWTSNPLVALYFACSDNNEKQEPGAIWAFVRKQHRHATFFDYTQNKDILGVLGIKIVYGPHISPRIPAQSGIFTTQQTPAVDLQNIDASIYKSEDCDIEKLVKWIVPKSKKKLYCFNWSVWGLMKKPFIQILMELQEDSSTQR